jgi:hypothetical protein
LTDDANAPKKRPAFQFYPADWRKDVELRSCSVAARGLWIDLMCIAHECEPYGHLTVNGRAMNAAQMAGQVGLVPAACKRLLDELIANGVARQTADGTVYSKRMIDDERVRNARAEGGKAGAEHGAKGAEFGNKGGRPKKSKGAPKTPLRDQSEPPPSSSSSTSSSPSGGPSTDALHPSRRSGDKPPAPTSATWDAYAAAYRGRYGVDPVRNASVNGKLANFVAKLAADEAPEVAAFFVGHDGALYVNASHPVDLLLRDAEALRMQWATGRQTRVIAAHGTESFRERDQRATRERMAQWAPGVAAPATAGAPSADIIDMEPVNAALRLG